MPKLLMGIIVVVFVLSMGCSKSIPEPEFLTVAPDTKTYSKAEQIKYKELSQESARMGWSYLSKYFNKNSFSLTVNRSYLGEAMDCFNYAWSFDYENYQAYWGVGVTRGVQATLTEDKQLIEKYLKQSVEFILMAKKYEVPVSQLDNLDLDLANAYNGLGAFYKQAGKAELAKAPLGRAKKILTEITRNDSQNGRAFFLLAATCFYQGKLDEAKQAGQKALSNNYALPETFLKDIGLPCKNSSKE